MVTLVTWVAFALIVLPLITLAVIGHRSYARIEGDFRERSLHGLAEDLLRLHRERQDGGEQNVQVAPLELPTGLFPTEQRKIARSLHRLTRVRTDDSSTPLPPESFTAFIRLGKAEETDTVSQVPVFTFSKRPFTLHGKWSGAIRARFFQDKDGRLTPVDEPEKPTRGTPEKSS